MDERRTILTDVAEGRLSPEEAAERLDALRGEPLQKPRKEEPPRTAAVKRVRVVGPIGILTVVGDSSVAEARARGPHRARYDDDTLVIETGDHESGPWHHGRRGPGWAFGWSGWGDWDDWKRRKTPVEVRMSPDLPLEVDLTMGSLTVRDLRGPVQLDVNAGTVRVERVSGPLTVSVTSGSVVVRSRIAQGDSRIRCELGNVAVQLEPGSSVRVTGRAHVGKVLLPGREAGFGAGLVEDTAVVGGGDATLEIETSAGAIKVTATA